MKNILRFINVNARRWYRSTGVAGKISVTILGIVALTAILKLARISMAQSASPAPSVDSSAIDAAIANSLAIVLADPAHPQDGAQFQMAVQSVFDALYPDLAESQRLQDPVYAQAQADSYASILHPEIAAAARQADPEAVRQEADELAALNQGVAEATAEYYSTLSAKLPSLQELDEADAQLLTNPAWLRQRQDPIKALAPGAQSVSPTSP
jgi:hypothetical protein